MIEQKITISQLLLLLTIWILICFGQCFTGCHQFDGFLLFKGSEKSSNFFYSDRLKPIILKNSDLVPRWSEKAVKTLVTILRQIFVCHVRSDLNQLQGVWGKDYTGTTCLVWHYRLWSFKTRDTKLERFLHKNQHTQRKWLNFENWTNGEPQNMQKLEFLKFVILIFHAKKFTN